MGTAFAHSRILSLKFFQFYAFQGDIGGPLTVNDGTVKRLIGVASFGMQNCGSGHPVAYARVTYYLQWIKNVTEIIRNRVSIRAAR